MAALGAVANPVEKSLKNDVPGILDAGKRNLALHLCHALFVIAICGWNAAQSFLLAKPEAHEFLVAHKFGFTMKIPALVLTALVSSTSSLLAADLVQPVEQPVVVQSSSGFYIGSLSSVNFLDDTSFGVGGTTVSTDYDVGFYSALRAGYDFGAYGFVSPRMELEIGYGTASVDEHSIGGVGLGGINSFGDARSIQGYVNGYLDIPLAADGALSAITPYVGGGVGFMNLDLRKQGVAVTGTLMDDSDTAFAYHLDAGFGINLQAIGLFSDVSLFDNTTLDIGYRFTAADNFDFTSQAGTSSSTDFRSNAVTFGFRKSF